MSSKDGDTDVPMDNNKVSNDDEVVVDPIMNEGVSFFFFDFVFGHFAIRDVDDFFAEPSGSDIAAMIDDAIPSLPPEIDEEDEEKEEEEVKTPPPASTRTKLDWIIYAPHWTKPKKEYGSYFIEAKQKTFLKNRPDMSWTLKANEKIECIKGRKYEIESELIAVENEFLHKKIVLVKDSILDQ